MATMTSANRTSRTTNALWTLIEPQEREVKLQLAKLINQSIVEGESEEAKLINQSIVEGESEEMMIRQETLSHIEQACKEAKLIRERKLKAVTLEELMNGL